jgi:TorA maturation chaperone TorD
MELFRALAAVAEAPRPELAPLAARLGLGELPPAHEHAELFAFQLVPYASIYLSQEGRAGGDARDRILGFWRVLGREPAAEADHLALMLASYAELCAAEREAAGGDGARHHRRAFLNEHLLSWLPVYLMRVLELGGRFYGAWARLLLDLLEREASQAAPPDIEPIHFRLSSPLEPPDPATDDPLTALLDGLVAPVRCGFVLTRRDLGVAAGELGIGCRMGERRYMLEAMLRQRPAAVLAWLAEHCDGTLEAFGRQPVALRSAFAPWAARARFTSRYLDAARAAATASGTGSDCS